MFVIGLIDFHNIFILGLGYRICRTFPRLLVPFIQYLSSLITYTLSFIGQVKTMTLSWLSSVFIFALVTSASPGPVNLLAMSAGVSAPLSQGLRFVFGATTGFCLLLLLSGLGLQFLIKAYPDILTE
ncbi:MAG: hypothetical protein CSA45_04455 [Gammaproteobacteria bacterium]|nr:MAG: hypothetical protein CSA45_04455 [Gammaproteobacteria bacterium]